MNNDELMQRLQACLPAVLANLKKTHFERYRFLRERLYKSDVTSDPDFQRTFNGLYRVRLRSHTWTKAFYEIMERSKDAAAPSFEETLNSIYQATGRVEASFASKLVAIINPHSVVYDSVVSRNLKMTPPSPHHPADQRLGEFQTLYHRLTERMNYLTQHSMFLGMSAALDRKFPGYNLTPIRRLDLLLWQLRK
jgi:hypothetical protein